ncbi:hypothetical protein PHJA_000788700 [Phtheirospermum japonicum]|uniref:Uncharacterized protein n=1 Tax=Phtheirospermum japonicum TaxID=374723 RepID=A0A830BLT9_9LAMI|nr:hypothetical protein PHJA_000788700 [Phtheirospermum japonicum]
MDVKALAKSKRAHSNHLSKKHNPHQASKAPSIVSDNKKPTGKQAKAKPPQTHVAKPLPSNWTRYDENLDSVSEEAQTSSSQPAEFVEPKSKGADYTHLISEANDQSRSNYSSDVFASFDDVINDFTQDFGSMLLAAKGQSILSWVNDDDFEFEGKTSASIEAPFLSLNLNSLAKHLAKAKLSERCFLDSDLYPLELLDDEVLQERGEDEHGPQTCISAAETTTKNIPVQTSKGESKPSKQDSFSPIPISERLDDSTAKKPPIFPVASAEAQLDMLLSSFSETNITESTHIMKTTNVDDDIDKLLEETSNLMNIDSRRVSNEVMASNDAISSTLDPSSKSKLLDDFDSWLDTI